MVAPDQVPPSELSMQKPKAMAPCPSVPRNESCAREPSMTATDQTKPSKLTCFGKFHYMFFDSLLVNTIFQFIFVQ